ncbi:hypothetical protein L1F30_11750 [Simiduia sp. 21SJ11W-1]|uniref:hypothetical protein n=1 Tax=Simiduia sp. 21SJ11W-1 TaxID=2909669 RepID=UPI00209FA818|nr:hypothetical protein [Simiduia sp. 21SJ11W-1]UTA46834.1 hypothetical protein L1F30_11750 [Simiduia sp. 21SJ11W-1]
MLVWILKLLATVAALGLLTVLTALCGAAFEQQLRFKPVAKKIAEYTLLVGYYGAMAAAIYLIWWYF